MTADGRTDGRTEHEGCHVVTPTWRLLVGDVRDQLATLPEASVQCVVTSPPYWGLRDYGTASSWEGGDPACEHRGKVKPRQDTSGTTTKRFAESRGTQPGKRAYAVVREVCRCGARRVDAQIGLEERPADYIASLVHVFEGVRRVLRPDGTCWLNLGDCYANDGKSGGETGGMQAYLLDNDRKRVGREKRFTGLKPKDLVGIPWAVAFALRDAGWWLRRDIVWDKRNAMPESVTDRPASSHEYIFLLTKSARYFYDADAVAEPASAAMKAQLRAAYEGQGLKDYAGAGVQNPSDVKRRILAGKSGNKARRLADGTAGDRPADHLGRGVPWEGLTRNCRSVWTFTTQPFTGWTQISRRVRVSWDESDDDTTRIASPDCPVHGDRAVLAATAACDGREASEPRGIARSDGDPCKAPLDGCVPTGQRLAPDSLEQSSDCDVQSHALLATSRNTRRSKTGRAPSTTQPCTPSAEIVAGTHGTSASPESGGSVERTPANSTSEGSASDGLVTDGDEIQRHIAGMCSCEYYRTVTEELSHFATFPETLPERCIKAGSRIGDTVLDPFCGSGTTGQVALQCGRSFIGIELNPVYADLARTRIGNAAPLFASEADQVPHYRLPAEVQP